MDPSVVFIAVFVFFAAWFQLSIYSFSFNVVASCVVILAFLYFSTVTHSLFPLENIIFLLFYKERTKSSRKNVSQQKSPFDKITFDDEITRKLRELIGHIVRDFILDWYNTVSDDVPFVQEAFELFEHAFTCVRARISSIDTNLLLSSVLHLLSRHLMCYQQAVEYASKIAPQDSERRRQLVIITYEKLLGHLAMSNYPDTEEEHLRSLTAVLLKALLPSHYRLTGASLYVVRELISKNVLFILIELLSDPKWINRSIVLVLEDYNNDDDLEESEDSDEDVTSSDYDEIADNFSNSISRSTLPVNSYISNEPATPLATPEDEFKVIYSVLLENEGNEDVNVSYEDNPNSPTSNDRIYSNIFETAVDDEESDLDKVYETQDTNIFLGDKAPFEGNPDVFKNKWSGSITNVKDAGIAMQFETTEREHSTLSSSQPVLKSSNNNNYADEHFFIRVRISETVTMEEPFEGGSRYTLYKIEYSAPIKKETRFLLSSLFRQERSSNDGDLPSTDVTHIEELQHCQVKRRFREFLNLQDRLNENQQMRRLVKNVKGPSRMFPMPIGNMDKEYIEKRRKFLQAYLRELCSIFAVSHSSEMKEFLAYNSDPRIAFVRNPSPYLPRFDKMLKNVVHDLFGAASGRIIRSEEVDFTVDEEATYVKNIEVPKQISASFKPITASSSSSCVSSLGQHHDIATSKMIKNNTVAKFKNIVLGKKMNLNLYEEVLRDYSPFTGPKNINRIQFGRNWRSPENLLSNRTFYYANAGTSRRRSQGDGCDQVYELESEINDDTTDFITGEIYRLVHQVWGVSVGTNSFLYLVLGGYTKKFVHLRMDDLTKKDQWLLYLKSLQHALWPGGVWKKDQEVPTDTKEKYLKALFLLEDTFPDALRYVVGTSRYKDGVRDLLDSFQNPVINRHVVYHLLDIVLKLLFPNLPSVISSASNVSL